MPEVTEGRMRRTKLVLLTVAVATTVLGCTSAPPAAPTSAPAAQTPTASPSEVDTGHSDAGQRGGRGRHGASLPKLVVALPAGVPLPPGVVDAFGRGPGRWSILLVVNGSAQQAQAYADAFYISHGFHSDSAYAVHGQGYRITMIADNRDHSATETNLTVVVTRQTSARVSSTGSGT
jgi:hypothetical protein